MTTRLNLLPWREIRRREQDRQLLTVAIGAWLLMGLIVAFAHFRMSDLIETQNQRNEFLQKEIAKLDEQIKEIAELKKKRAALIARMNVIQQLQSDRTRVVYIFDELARRLPEGVHFLSLKRNGDQLALTGAAQSNARVSALMRNLSSSDWFLDPLLNVINVKQKGKGKERVSEFSLKVKNVARKAAAPETGT